MKSRSIQVYPGGRIEFELTAKGRWESEHITVILATKGEIIVCPLQKCWRFEVKWNEETRSSTMYYPTVEAAVLAASIVLDNMKNT